MKATLKENLTAFFVLAPAIALVTYFYWPKETAVVEQTRVDRDTLTEKLNILVWENYIPEDGDGGPHIEFLIYDSIARDYGIDVRIHYFDSNESLYEKLINPEERAKYDLVMPSNFLVPTLVANDLLEPLNRENIPNWEKIDTRFRSDYLLQELLEYSAPYIFGVGGIAYDRWNSYEIPLNWGFLLDPGNDFVDVDEEKFNYENIEAEMARRASLRARVRYQLKGKISLIDDMRTTLGTALIHLGYEANSTKSDEINEAADFIITLINELDARIESTDVAGQLISGETHMAMAWSGDAMVAMSDAINTRKDKALDDIEDLRVGETQLKSTVRDEIPKIRFTSPQPKALAFLDCFAIVKGSPNVSNAEVFINRLLDPVVAAQVTNFSFYGNTVSASKEFINRDILNGPPYFLPSDDSVSLITPVTANVIVYYQDAWKRILEAAGHEEPATIEVSGILPEF